MKLVDSHAHLDKLDISNVASLEAMLARAAEARVFHILSVATTLAESEKIIKQFASYPQIFCSAGIHPHLIQKDDDMEYLRVLAHRPEIIAIGETGLDFSQPIDRQQQLKQKESFFKHIEIASEVDKPLIVHMRNATQETFHILREAHLGRRFHARGVIHCFTGDREAARAALNLGFYISFSGILTFKNALDLREVAKYVPLDCILLETDAPYLAPVPFRGQRNEPTYLRYIAEQLAIEKGCTVEVLAHQTTESFGTLFKVETAL